MPARRKTSKAAKVKPKSEPNVVSITVQWNGKTVRRYEKEIRVRGGRAWGVVKTWMYDVIDGFSHVPSLERAIVEVSDPFWVWEDGSKREFPGKVRKE